MVCLSLFTAVFTLFVKITFDHFNYCYNKNNAILTKQQTIKMENKLSFLFHSSSVITLLFIFVGVLE